MCCSMIISNRQSLPAIDNGFKGSRNVSRQPINHMDDKVIFFFCICDNYFFPPKLQYAFIAYLSATFSIERSRFQYKLVLFLGLCFYFSILHHLCVRLQIFITNKLCLARFLCLDPVFGIYFSCGAGTILLLLHFIFKSSLINYPTFFRCN